MKHSSLITIFWAGRSDIFVNWEGRVTFGELPVTCWDWRGKNMIEAAQQSAYASTAFRGASCDLLGLAGEEYDRSRAARCELNTLTQKQFRKPSAETVIIPLWKQETRNKDEALRLKNCQRTRP
jgi:hypothetical protein